MDAINTFINVSEIACHSSHNSYNWGAHSHTILKMFYMKIKTFAGSVESATCAIK